MMAEQHAVSGNAANEHAVSFTPLPLPQLWPDYKNLSLLLKKCPGINNTTSRCAGHDGKGKSLPLLYQVISMVLSGPDCQ